MNKHAEVTQEHWILLESFVDRTGSLTMSHGEAAQLLADWSAEIRLKLESAIAAPAESKL